MKTCPVCQQDSLVRRGKNRSGSQSFYCKVCAKTRTEGVDYSSVVHTNGYNPEAGLNWKAPNGLALEKLTHSIYSKDGNTVTHYKTKVDQEQKLEALRLAVDEINKTWRVVKPIKSPLRTNDRQCAVYKIGDPHCGMLSWDKETGDSYDIAIFEKMHKIGLGLLMGMTPATRECILFDAGDHFHYDNIYQQTTRSRNAVDAASRFGKMISVGMRAIVDWVEMALRKHEIVHVVLSRGNHDDVLSEATREMVAIRFHDNPRVKVNLDKSVFAYHRFGSTLFGFTHGNQCKPEKLPSIMANDQRDLWGLVTYTVWYFGHFHCEKVIDAGGTILNQIATLAAQEAYSKAAGYINQRAISADVYDVEFGKIGEHRVTSAMIEAHKDYE